MASVGPLDTTGPIRTIGVDAHKRVHAAVLVDVHGRAVAQWRGANTPAGWRELVNWATDHGCGGTQVVWGIEGARQYGRGLAQTLLADGVPVVEVNPRWTAAARRTGRSGGKSDRLDAQAVAHVVQREPDLPRLAPPDQTALLAVLAAELDTLRRDEAALRNQLHQLVVQLDPAYETRLPALATRAGVQAVLDLTVSAGDMLAVTRLATAQRVAERLLLVSEHRTAVRRQLTTIGERDYQPLTEIAGIAGQTAAELAGLLGDGKTFPTEAKLASYSGTAPLEASSGERVRHRLNRRGDRRLNAIIERIALTQARCYPPAQAYLARRQRDGKTRREAIRCLKRSIVRAIWHAWQRCTPPPLT